jgi:hypothetical protein
MLKFAILVLAACLTPIVGVGQGLDGDFNHLSAKERSRIAQEEESGASKDERYQAVMAEAEALFQQHRFEEALERFKVARDLRPYNVYPRVKIQDLQALIAKRDATVQAASAPELGKGGELDHPETVSLREALEPVPGAAEERPNEPTSPPVHRVPEHRTEGARTPAATQRTEPPVVRAERVHEHVEEPLEEGGAIYMEGRAVVVERRVAQEGRIAVYRKVTHPWGAVVYFKDAAAIPERMWTEVFGSR